MQNLRPPLRIEHMKLGTFKKTVQDEFNAMIARGKPCAKCGNRYDVMHCSHVRSIGSYPNIRYDVFNVLPMCARHHKWWWHEEPLDASDWFRKNYRSRDEYLQIAKNIPRHYKMEDVKQVREWIRNREIDKLHYSKEEIERWLKENGLHN